MTGSNLKECKQCGSQNQAGARFCLKCGSPLAISCANCGAEAAAEARFCSQCGAALTAAGTPASPQPAAQPGPAGMIEITRKNAMTGLMYKVTVYLDNLPVGSLANKGFAQVQAAAGGHMLMVKGGGLSNSQYIVVENGQTLRYQTGFSEMGIAGGGLRLDRMP